MGEFDNDTFIEEGGEGLKGLPGRASLHVVITMQVLLCLGGSLANLLLLYVYGRRGEQFTYTIGILTLAVKDLLCCSVLLPFFAITEAMEYRITSDFFCKLFHFIGNLASPLTMYVLMLLSIERCACVCHSHLHATRRKTAYIIVVVVVTWTIVQAIFPSLGFGVYGHAPTDQIQKPKPSNESSTALVKIVNIGVCHFNMLLISRQAMKRYVDYFKSQINITASVMILAYVIILIVTMYRKYRPKPLLLDSQLGEMRHTVAGSEPEVIFVHVGSTFPQGGADQNFSSEERERSLIEKEQNLWALRLFVVTVFFWVLILPALLMVYQHVVIGPVLFYLHHIQFAATPVILVTMDTCFRKEVKDLFKNSWTRLTH